MTSGNAMAVNGRFAAVHRTNTFQGQKDRNLSILIVDDKEAIILIVDDKEASARATVGHTR
jgi:hypothetical protein